MHAPAPHVAERITAAVGTVEAVDQRTCILHTGADALDTLAVYLGLLGTDFVVTDPPELVAHRRELAALRPFRPGLIGTAWCGFAISANWRMFGDSGPGIMAGPRLGAGRARLERALPGVPFRSPGPRVWSSFPCRSPQECKYCRASMA